MAGSKFKRLLWSLNEFMNASACGISMKELSDKWERSSMNDGKERGIPERTFYRIRRSLEDSFGIEIECIRVVEPRYRISHDDLEPGNNNLLTLFLNKAQSEQDGKTQSLKEVLNLLIRGNELSADDKDAIKAIAESIRRVPYEYGEKLISSVRAGEIEGADCVDWDEDYRSYVCVWNEDTYTRTDIWLSIGFYDDRVLFYIVTGIESEEVRKRLADALDVENGEMYRRGYWWYEPKDKSLFQIRFDTVPNMREVNRRIEVLLARIATYAEEIQKRVVPS